MLKIWVQIKNKEVVLCMHHEFKKMDVREMNGLGSEIVHFKNQNLKYK